MAKTVAEIMEEIRGGNNGKGNTPSSPSSTRTKRKTVSGIMEEIRSTQPKASTPEAPAKKDGWMSEQLWGAAAQATAKTNKPATNVPATTPVTEKEETPHFSDYSSAVKYLEEKGIDWASGIMTENEWRRRGSSQRNYNGGATFNTYEAYLDHAVSNKLGNGNSFIDTKAYDDKLTEDIRATEKEIKGAKANLRTLEAPDVATFDPKNLIGKEVAAQKETIKEAETKLAKLYEEKKERGTKTYDTLPQESDFEKFSQPDKGITRSTATNENDFEYGIINKNEGFEEYQTDNIYSYLNDEERKKYNYIYKKYGSSYAHDYVESLKEVLNQRQGHEIANETDGFIDHTALAVMAGTGQFVQGAEQLFTDDAIVTDPSVYAAQEVSSNLNGVGKVAFDLTQTVSNMAPSLVVGAFNPIAGTAVMGASASGNAYNEKIKEGYSVNEARTYSVLVGASEALTQYFLGGIGKLGGVGVKGLTKAAPKLAKLNNVFGRVAKTVGNNAVGRVLGKTALSASGEGLEEGLQPYIASFLAMIVFNEEYEAPDFEEVLYSALLGFLSGGLLEGAGHVVTEVNTRGVGKDLKESAVQAEAEYLGLPVEELEVVKAKAAEDGIINAIIEEGLASDENSPAYKVATQLQAKVENGETITNYDLGRLYGENVRYYSNVENAEEDVTAQANDPLVEAARAAVNAEQDIAPVEQEATPEVETPVVEDVVTPEAQAIEEELATQQAVSERAALAAFEAGRANVPRESVNLQTPEQELAYNEGRIEHIKNMGEETTAKNVETTIENSAEQEYNGNRNVPATLTGKSRRVLDKTRKMVGVADGRAYITDGYVAFPIESSDVEFAQSEWGATTSDSVVNVLEKSINENEYVPLTSNPIEGKLGNGLTAYVFTTEDGREIAIQKKYAKYFDGYNFSATFNKNGVPYAVKVTDKDGNFAGLVMSIRPDKDGTYKIPETKEVSMRSFKNKPAAKVASEFDEDGNPVYAMNREEANIEGTDFDALRESRKKADERYGLTKEEGSALSNYTQVTFSLMNRLLYTDSPISENDMTVIKYVKAALMKFPVFTGRTYRNLRFDNADQYSAFLEEHSKGATVTLKAFTSTSKRPNGYPVFDDYVVHMVVDGKTGADISDSYGMPRQQEVILFPGTAIEITAVTTANDGHPLIYAQEVVNHGLERDYGTKRPARSDEENRSENMGGETSVRGNGEGKGEVRKATRNNGRGNGVLSEWGTSAERFETSGTVEEKSSAQDVVASEVLKYIERGKDFSPARLFEIADRAYGGTMAEGKYTVKDAYDGMELAVNRYLMNAEFVKSANTDAKTAVKTIEKLTELLSHIPTQTKRTAEMESYQQFSTPPNIAYVAAWAANINSNDVVLEPSAGIGGLALWGKAWGADVYANELSTRRLAFLNKLGLDGTFNLNAEQIDNLLPDRLKPSVVVMNPPFSATAGRMSKNDTKNATRHIEQALERLEPNGRLVAILGNGMADDAPAFKSWWNSLREEYNVRANIRIDGSNYRKYGTTFDVQLVVIDKTGATTEETLTGTYKDLSAIPALLEGIRNDRQTVVRDGDVITERDTATRNDTKRNSRPEHVDEPSSDVLDGQQREGETGVRTVDGEWTKKRNGTRNNRTARDNETVQSSSENADASTVQQGDAGIRMELSRSSDSSLDGKSVVKEVDENPDSVYATYVPRKVHIKGAKKHPARLVESAAMAAVEPPDVTYTPSLPASVAEKGILSDAQLENVVYAGQAHNQTLADGRRKGFFIGDGTGVGKGRQISGIIMDNFLQGRKKAVWISASTGLVNDAKRDWKDLGGNPDDIIDLKGTKLLKTGIEADSGILFGAYSTLSNSANKEQRFAMLKEWLGEDFDGVIALDEAHKMGNSVPMKKKRGKSKPSQQAITGIELQNAFPNARIVYASATGATDISQYGYLERLGLWGQGTAFNDLNDFITKISTGGLAAMELVARDMKAMGVYMARSISFDDVKYDTLQHDLTPMQTEIYDTMSEAWQKVLQNVNAALEVTGADKNGQARGAAYSAIFGGQQRFYNQILTSMAMPSVIESIKKELADGKSVVIQLTNTNEAQANRAIAKNEAEGGNLDEIDLTPSESLTQLLEKSFPVQVFEEYTDDEGRVKSRLVTDANGNPVIDKRAVRMRDNLIAELQQMKVPDGPLEMLLDAFGVDQVAEVTGRSRRVVEKRDEHGNMRRVIETRSATAGTADAKAFQDGKKRILVFSDAGGTGFSYHADKRAKNQQQRVHFLLQPGWSASNAVQGFGRTHRSNQASAPIVRLITTNAMGQKRFTSTIARRLDQLGALTKGQRQTGSGVFSEKDNLENPIAADALSQYYKTADRDMLKKIGLYDSLFNEYGQLNDSSDDLRNVSKFLNRILSLPVSEQNEVFQGFYDTFERMMDVAISNGTVDMGLENYRADRIEVIDETVIRKDESGADTKYVQMRTYKNTALVPFSQVGKGSTPFKGLVRMEDGSVRAVYEISSKTNARGEVERRFRLESPVRGISSTYVEKTLNEKTTPIDKAEWKQAWQEETDKAPEYTEGTLHLLTGTLLPIWNRLPDSNTRVMRVISSDGRQYLGRVIPPSQIDSVLRGLGAGRTMQTYTPQQVSDIVLTQGKEVVLRDNRQKIVRRRVSGEWRMEITGQNTWYLQRQYPDIITERINFEYRYFIPTGENGVNILGDLIKNNPVVDVRTETKHGDVDERKVPDSAEAVKEWTAKRVGDTNKTPKSLSEIVEQIRHDFGINITRGHVRGALGQYNRRDQGIRTKITNHLPTISHELGHHFDNIYSITENLPENIEKELVDALPDATKATYPEEKWAREGMAEYIRKFMQDSDSAKLDYPEFTDHFLNKLSTTDYALFAQIADEVNAYYSLDADTFTSSVRLREEGRPDARTYVEKIKDKASVLYQAWVDTNHGITRLDRAAGTNASLFARQAAYADAVAGQIITGDLSDLNGNYIGHGLQTALKGVNLKDKVEYKHFGEYLIAKHAPERMAEGMDIVADPRKNNPAFMERRATELEEQYPQFKEAAERLYDFQAQLGQAWLVDTGLVSQEAFDSWLERWQFYVPLNRAVSIESGTKKGFANQNSPIKKARGGTEDIYNPVDNIVSNIIKMVNVGTKNNVWRIATDGALALGANANLMEQIPAPMVKHGFSIVDVKNDLIGLLEGSELSSDAKDKATEIVTGLDDILYQYSKGKAHGNVVTVMKDGKPQFWKINDAQLLASITSMSPAKMEGILDAYGAVSKFMTSTITGYNVVWSLFSNFPRDIATLFTYSKTKNPIKVFASMGYAYVNKINRSLGKPIDPLYREYIAMGGGNISAYSADRDFAKRARQKLAGKKIFNPIIDPLVFVSDLIELGPRFATYKLLREQGLSTHEAFDGAMDITVNFRRGGTLAREINKVVPFFNVSVQGLDKFRRWITAEELAGKAERKDVIKSRTFGYVAVSAALAAIVYALNNWDEEEKENYHQLSNYQKNSFWNIPIGDGKYFAIPKPRELAVLSSFFETAMEYGIGENDKAFVDFGEYAANNLLPKLASDIAMVGKDGVAETGINLVGNLGIVGVFGYLGANRDFLGRPIVSSALQNLEPKDQYTNRTSKIAHWVGQSFNQSPVQVDYFFQQVLGGFWKYLKALSPVGGENVDLTLGVQNTYIKDNQFTTDLVNWMYEQAEKSAKAKNSAPGNMDKAIAARMDSNMTSFYSRYYKLAKDKKETTATRGVRQTVLNMIKEYQKASDNNYVTPYQKAVYDVIKATGETDNLPSVMPSTIKDANDKTHTLSDMQYVEYQTDYNRLYWEYATDYISKASTAEAKEKALAKAKRDAKEEATSRVLKRIGAPTQKWGGSKSNSWGSSNSNWGSWGNSWD